MLHGDDLVGGPITSIQEPSLLTEVSNFGDPLLCEDACEEACGTPTRLTTGRLFTTTARQHPTQTLQVRAQSSAALL